MTIAARTQDQEKPVVRPVQYFIGIQPGFMPSFTDQWGKTVWDINLIPLTFEYAINRHWALRLHSIYNLGVGGYDATAATSSMGLEIAAPVYLALKNSEEGHRGFFVAPVITPGYNIRNPYYTLRLAGEAGFSFLFAYKWSLSISAQAGTELQKMPVERFVRFVPYTIPVIALGIWL